MPFCYPSGTFPTPKMGHFGTVERDWGNGAFREEIAKNHLINFPGNAKIMDNKLS